jgi:hypothetical protein
MMSLFKYKTEVLIVLVCLLSVLLPIYLIYDERIEKAESFYSIPIGKMKEMKQLSVAWNESDKCQVITDKSMYTVYGLCSGVFGDEIYVLGNKKMPGMYWFRIPKGYL